MAFTSDQKDRPNYKINLPADEVEALRWVVERVSKLMSDRKMTADKIAEVKKSARNDGFANETVSASIRFARMSPEHRTVYVERLKDSLRLYGFDADVADRDDSSPRAKLHRAHVQKLLHLMAEKREISAEITQIYASAKDHGVDVPVLKQIVRIRKMDVDDREEWFARLDSMGAKLGFW